jgi:hypothetical protein
MYKHTYIRFVRGAAEKEKKDGLRVDQRERMNRFDLFRFVIYQLAFVMVGSGPAIARGPNGKRWLEEMKIFWTMTPLLPSVSSLARASDVGFAVVGPVVGVGGVVSPQAWHF